MGNNKQEDLVQGNRNSRFFHNKMKKMVASTTIYRLKNDLNNWVDSHEDIANILNNSFKKWFTSIADPNRRIDLDHISTVVNDIDKIAIFASVAKK